MSILNRQEREKLVLDLYNQGKTIREIAKEARMSFRDIGVILNKVIEKKEEGNELQEDAEKTQEQKEEQQHLSLAAQAYKLFSESKTPIEVAIELNLGESETTKFYKEYWKLKQLHNLSVVYEEIKDDITSFLKFYKLARDKGMDVEQIVNLLKIANNDLPAIEEQYKRLRNNVSMLQFQKYTYETNLYQLSNQIAATTKLLNSFHISCERERRDVEHLQNRKTRLITLITQFKNNNEEYLKIEQTAEEYVKNVLTNSKLLLQFATASAIESVRRNHELYNFVSYSISNNNDTYTTSYGSNHLSFISGEEEPQQSFNDIYTALISEEAEKLYNTLKTELINRFMTTAAAAAIRASSLPSPSNNH